MKSWFRLSSVLPFRGDRVDSASWEQSLALGRKGRLLFQLEHLKVRKESQLNLNADLRWYF